jgi:hypothetical protein
MLYFVGKSKMKEKRYFVEIVIKDSETLEPVHSISTKSDYTKEQIRNFPQYEVAKDVQDAASILYFYAFEPIKK